jgi:phosphoribosylaminoimidazole (AIR) synthetase
VQEVLPLIRAGWLKGLAHITGGGLIDNPPRMLPDHLLARFDWTAWTLPPVFAWLAEVGGIETHELRRAFNCGIGLVGVAAASDADAILVATPDARIIGALEPKP